MTENEIRRERERARVQRERDSYRIYLGNEIGRDRTEAFNGMESVGVIIRNVIEEIKRARYQRERNGHRRNEKERPVPARHRSLRVVGEREEPGEKNDAFFSPVVDSLSFKRDS